MALQETMKKLKERADDDRAYAVGEARRALYEARRELDQIESQLEKAVAGEPYLRVGTVHGVSAVAVFAAFGEIERSAVLDRMIAEGEAESKSELIRSGVVCGTCADEGETSCSCWMTVEEKMVAEESMSWES